MEELFPGLAGLFVFIPWLLTAIVHVGFALAVYRNARDNRDMLGHAPVFVAPIIWGIATLIGGVFVAVAYWLIHHSKLRTEQVPLDITSKPRGIQGAKPPEVGNY